MTIGYSEPNPTPDDRPLWSQYRRFFPVTDQLVYMHHAGVAPLSRPAAEAMSGLAQDAMQFGSLHYDAWLATYGALRVAAAELIKAGVMQAKVSWKAT